jgi:hypothetical protein
VAGIRDGVAAGYDALEYVLEGLRASIERRGGGARGEAGIRQGAGGYERRRHGYGAPLDVVDDLTGIAAEIIGLVGEVAQETAESITERARKPARRGGYAPLELAAEPGKEANVEFHVWNTTSTVLSRVDLVASDLVDHEERIDADAVTFDPPRIDRILPGRPTEVEVTVDVPRRAVPGTYRGVIQAQPGDAWAVLELKIVPEEETRSEPSKATADQGAAGPPVPAEPKGSAESSERSAADSAKKARRMMAR